MEVKRVLIEAEVQAGQLSLLNTGLKTAADNAGLTESGIKKLNDELVNSALRSKTLQQRYNDVEREMKDLQRASQKLATLKREATDSSDVHKYTVAWSRTNIELDKARRELVSIEKQAGRAGTKLKSIDVGKGISSLQGQKVDFGKILGNVGPIKNAQASISNLLGVIGPGSGGLIGTLGSAAAATGPLGIGLAAIGAAGAAAFSIANNEGKQFENGLLSLQSILGLTDTELAQLKETALNTGFALETSAGSKNITRNAIEAAGAFEIIGSRVPVLLESQEALAAFTNRVILLDEASQTLSFDGAVDALTIAVNQFLGDGATFEDAVTQGTVVMNQLAEASKIGAVPIDGAASSLKNFGSVAAANNITTGASIALVEVLGQRFVDPARTGTSLRNVIQKLSAETGDFAIKNGDIVSSLKAVRDAELSTVEIQKLFSAENEAAVRILLNNISQVENFTGVLEAQAAAQFETGTAAQQAAVNAKGLQNAQNNLSNAVVNLKAQLGTALTPALTVLVEFITGAIEVGAELGVVFGEMSDGVSLLLSPIGWLIDAFSSTGDELEETEEKGSSFKFMMDLLRAGFRLLLGPISFTLSLLGRISRAFDIAKEAGGGFINTLKALVNAITFFDIFELPKLETEKTQEEIDKLKEENEEPVEIPVKVVPPSLKELKDRLKELKDAFEEATSNVERKKIAIEVTDLQKQITQIESVFKPDKENKKKAKEAEKKAREEAKKELDEEKEIEVLTKLTAKIQIEGLKNGGKDTEASLQAELKEQLRILENDKNFGSLSIDLQGQARLNIENDFQKKVQKVRDEASDEIIKIQEDALDSELQLIAKRLAEESLSLDQSFALRLENEKLTKDEIEKVETEIAALKKAKAKEALDDQLDAIERLKAANASRIDALKLRLSGATEEETKKIQTELESREEFQKTLESNTIEIKQKSAEAQIEITKDKTTEEEETEKKSQEQKLSDISSYISLASTLQSGLSNIFSALKEKEVAAAGDNKEKLAEIEKKDFNRRKALTLVDIAINTASAIVQAIAKFGPPPSPLGIAGISIASAIGLIQAGIVASSKPPAFFEGVREVPRVPGKMGKDSIPAMVDDSYPIRVHSGERIIPEHLNKENSAIYNSIEEGKTLVEIISRANGIDPLIISDFIENRKVHYEYMQPYENDEEINIKSPENKRQIDILYQNFPELKKRKPNNRPQNPIRSQEGRHIGINPLIPTQYPLSSELVLDGIYMPESSISRKINQAFDFWTQNTSQIHSNSKNGNTLNTINARPITNIYTAGIDQKIVESISGNQDQNINIDMSGFSEELSKKIKSNESDLDHVYYHLIRQNERIIKLLKDNK